MLEVGGLDLKRTEHLDWAAHELELGDRIELEIVDATRVSEPIARRGPTQGVETLSAKPRASKRPARRASAPAGGSGQRQRTARTAASKRRPSAKKRVAKAS